MGSDKCGRCKVKLNNKERTNCSKCSVEIMEQVSIVNEAVMYANWHRGAATKDGIVNVMSVFYTNDELKEAKDLLWLLFDQFDVLGDKCKRRDSHNRRECMATCEDIIDALNTLAEKQVKFICYASKWDRIPKSDPESANTVVLSEKIARLECLIKNHDNRLSELRIDVDKNQDSVRGVEDTSATHGNLLQELKSVAGSGSKEIDRQNLVDEDAESSEGSSASGGASSLWSGVVQTPGPSSSGSSDDLTKTGDSGDALEGGFVRNPHDVRKEKKTAQWNKKQQWKGKNQRLIGNANSCDISGAPTPSRDFFVSRVDKSVTIEKITAYIRKKGVQFRNLVKTSHTEAANASFKLTIDFKDVDTVYQETFWPKGVWVRKWQVRNEARNENGNNQRW